MFEELRRKNSQLNLIADDGYMKADPYDYYGVVSNFPIDLATEKVQLSEKESIVKRYSLQEVIIHHQQRPTCKDLSFTQVKFFTAQDRFF